VASGGRRQYNLTARQGDNKPTTPNDTTPIVQNASGVIFVYNAVRSKDATLATIHENPELITQALAGDIESRNEAVMRMWPFFYGMAIKISHRYGTPIDELAQIAVVKVCQEFHRYRPELKLSPLTYFGRIAWRAMADYASRDSVVMPAIHWHKNEKTYDYGVKARNTFSLEQMNGSDSDGIVGDIGMDSRVAIEDHRELAPELVAGTCEAKELIHEALQLINARQADIIRSRLKGETLADIGRRLRLTRERIRQIEDQAMAALHKIIKAKIRQKRLDSTSQD
jgi:RNA polymerase sigma factor (sigma-70 family)